MASANGAIGWDDEVSSADAGENTQQQDEFVLLPPGTYPFEIKKVERGSFNGSEKLPPCGMVKVGIIVDGGDAGRNYINHRFFMHTSTLWKIYQFMEAIGLRKKGDSTASAIPWAKVTKGMTGRCEINKHPWKDKVYNEVDKWLPDDEPAEAPEEADEPDDSDY